MHNTDGVSIALTLVEDSGKWLESAPEHIGVGVLRLRRWQVQPVEFERGVFDGSSAYLVRVNYELELEPDSVPMLWFEIGFRFDGDTEVTVLDAVPYGSIVAQSACSYVINRNMQLVPTESDRTAQVHVPAVEERVDLHGVGSSSVRWRHSTHARSGVRPGSRSAWFLLLVSGIHSGLPCQLEARYELRSDSDTEYRPAQEPAMFTLEFGEPAGDATIRPSVTAAVRTEPLGDEPAVFVCYAHESARFKADVRRLANALMTEGVDPHLDQFDAGPRQNWQHRSIELFQRCDFVLVLASPTCREVGDGMVRGNRNAGLRSELTLLQTLYSRYPEWAKYVLPVVLPGQSRFDIPLFLGPENEDYYEVHDYTPAGIEYLMSAIRRTPRRTWELK